MLVRSEERRKRDEELCVCYLHITTLALMQYPPLYFHILHTPALKAQSPTSSHSDPQDCKLARSRPIAYETVEDDTTSPLQHFRASDFKLGPSTLQSAGSFERCNSHSIKFTN